MTIYDVISDVAFSAPTVWVYDVVTTAIAVAFLIGGSYALMRREHIRITVVYDRLSSRTRLRCDVVTSLLAIVTFRTYGSVNSYVLLSVPMFLMMASILDKSGVAHDLHDALKIWAGRVPGGVGVMTLIAASVMAAMTGIIGGEVILLGLVALPQMLRPDGHRARLRPDLARGPVQYHHAGRLSVAAFRSGCCTRD